MNRYEVRPGAVAGRFSVVDTSTGLCARKGRRPIFGLTRDEANRVAARMNDAAGRRRVCRACRHLHPVDEVVNGRCRTCAA